MNYEEIIQTAEVLQELLAKHGCFAMNIVDELHANENAHSRVLTVLLSYKGMNQDYQILTSFLKIPSINSVIDFNVSIKTPRFTSEQERIDLLIEEPSKFAIIVENKIHNAVDQDKQIERYLKKVIQHGIPPEKIIVVYLTKDGSKRITDKSLTEYARKTLGYSNTNSGRFIQLNYRDHILPWLEEVLLSCPVKEKLLISAIIQYIDHLKGILQLRNMDTEKIINEEIKDRLNIDGLDKISEYLKNINDLYTKLESVRQDYINKYTDECIISPFKKYLEGKGIEYELEIGMINYWNIELSVRIKSLEHGYFKIDTKDRKIFYGIANYQVNITEDKAVNLLQDEDSFQQTAWWSAWKYGTFTELGNDSFWESVQNGEFEKKLEACFDYVYNKIK